MTREPWQHQAMGLAAFAAWAGGSSGVLIEVRASTAALLAPQPNDDAIPPQWLRRGMRLRDSLTRVEGTYTGEQETGGPCCYLVTSDAGTTGKVHGARAEVVIGRPAESPYPKGWDRDTIIEFFAHLGHRWGLSEDMGDGQTRVNLVETARHVLGDVARPEAVDAWVSGIPDAELKEVAAYILLHSDGEAA